MTDHIPRRVAMIPARIGSTRLSMKNLALIDGQPLISYAIQAAKEAGVFDRVVVNSDAPVFERIAERYGVEFYRRPPALGSSTTKSDDVVYDFIKQNPCEVLAWVNPTSPLQTGEEIRQVAAHFDQNGLDSLITSRPIQVHADFDGRPLNYRTDELFAQTQDLTPVELFVYSILMWRTRTFITTYDAKGHAFFAGKMGLFPVSPQSAIIVKREEDLRLAEFILKARRSASHEPLRYDPLAGEARHA